VKVLYQKHEIIVKKNANLMEKFAVVEDEMYEKDIFSVEQEDQYLKSHFTDEEISLVTKTKNAYTYLKMIVQYYLDVLEILEKYSYEYYGEKKPYVTLKKERQENENEIRIVIEEFWNDDFESSCINGFMDDGFSPFADYDELPRVVRFLYDGIDRHEFLQKEYVNNLEHYEGCVIYNCIARYFDNCNCEGAIGVFNHEINEFDIYGYGVAMTGQSGSILEDNIIEREFLKQNPDKLWYPTNPLVCWRPIGSVNIENYPSSEYKNDIQPLFDAIESDNCYASYHEGGYTEYDDGIYDEDEIEIVEIKGCGYDEPPITSLEILEIIDNIENANRIFIEVQKKSCQRNGFDNISDFVNSGFRNNLLFNSDDGEVLYIGESDIDESGLRNEKLVLHCKKFWR